MESATEANVSNAEAKFQSRNRDLVVGKQPTQDIPVRGSCFSPVIGI
ncbi:hypothetical protein SYNPCC7002_D0016 (plasmid) [Picosynechococcus sp. PCC 7002]|nr:hypothetical protein SYNPCC7002_D0016 [Picosynechococcus sp. PCC 7002]